MSVHAIILAAGQGSRMKSDLPKVLHKLAGKTLLERVVTTVSKLDIDAAHVVIGHGADTVRSSIEDPKINWSVQAEQLGTGHAVAQALPKIPDDALILVVYGDVPLLDADTLASLLGNVTEQSLALLTVHLADPSGYGRIIRDDQGHVNAIVEQKDANSDQLQINEINTGILAVSAAKLKLWLPALSNQNAQGEYYLTDIIAMAVAEGMTVVVSNPRCEEEVEGINTRRQLAALERWYQARLADQLMRDGVTLLDPARVDIRGNLNAGIDTIIDINSVFEGEVVLGKGVTIGPNCLIKNSTIGDDTSILANSVIEDAIVGRKASVGPFARLRPGTRLADRSKVGNFVETKNTVLGEGSKINHLSYVGDAVLGHGVNIGAGTITCNYDGVNKFKTEIGDQVFVGSNTSLIAPVIVNSNATIGAGSTITHDVSDNQLAIARARQRNIDGWRKPEKK